ncbi:hypothetical protein GCM10018793_09480 [Streptomyces sulfonofaciens]|uniref:Uncharacterized protein n=1 Tax=Streptomyces sulfonofaciens TaxID=68272 RepID=A0A919FV46_9ACTN|nr:hypothetical protein GCM10018793_09480 [Streptomyces sulfonofaciens]
MRLKSIRNCRRKPREGVYGLVRAVPKATLRSGLMRFSTLALKRFSSSLRAPGGAKGAQDARGPGGARSRAREAAR